MCKHILNVQVSIRAPCCKQWFDCSDCHKELTDHKLKRQQELVFGCKKCKKVFRKNTNDFDQADEYCPHCDNHYVLPAQTRNDLSDLELPTLDTDIRVDNSMLLDVRMKQPSLEEQLKDLDYSDLLG
ncbi:hypothetical protein K502DRAFT_297230 [Neoconidiobolus thromboides FSU 785]|nr:hypothetical protein K502DRAFT_297230 [Neoconidiobolus thromboides FSU 785]